MWTWRTEIDHYLRYADPARVCHDDHCAPAPQSPARPGAGAPRSRRARNRVHRHL